MRISTSCWLVTSGSSRMMKSHTGIVSWVHKNSVTYCGVLMGVNESDAQYPSMHYKGWWNSRVWVVDFVNQDAVLAHQSYHINRRDAAESAAFWWLMNGTNNLEEFKKQMGSITSIPFREAVAKQHKDQEVKQS